ncbi:Cilia/flagella-associated protein 20/WDR90/C3orf67 [Gongronella butleri]|nr:Cilia/flagella-associated protein 20/WDR90/C3orf67 [Gongronella butleri]
MGASIGTARILPLFFFFPFCYIFFCVPQAMFRHTFQSGPLSILYSLGSEPLQLWSVHSEDENPDDTSDGAHVQTVKDTMISSNVIELLSRNVATTYITCPPLSQRSLGIKLPFLVFLVRNMDDRYMTFEVQIVDDQQETRRLRASNYQLETRVRPEITTMPLRLDPGWNQMTLDLADLVKRAYGTQYVETTRVTIHANCRLRRVYFTDRLYAEDDLPAEFKLFLPVDKT